MYVCMDGQMNKFDTWVNMDGFIEPRIQILNSHAITVHSICKHPLDLCLPIPSIAPWFRYYWHGYAWKNNILYTDALRYEVPW